MSKKQREKVEDEVRFHKANQQRTGVSETSPDSSYYEPATPTPSDMYTTPYMSSFSQSDYNYPQQCSASTTVPFEVTSDYVDSTTFDIRQNSMDHIPSPVPILPDSGAMSPSIVSGERGFGQRGSSSSTTTTTDDAMRLGERNTTERSSEGSMAGRDRMDDRGNTSLYINPDMLIKQEVEQCFELGMQVSSLEAEANAIDAATGVSSVSDSSLPFVDSTTYLSPISRTTVPSPTAMSHDQAVSHPHQQSSQHLDQSHHLLQGHQTPVPGTTLLPDDQSNNYIPNISENLLPLIAEAVQRSCNHSTEQLQDMMRKSTISMAKVSYYKNMAHEELWQDCAKKVTEVLKQVIDFAKMIPGFRKLPQEDQIALVKSGGFELVMLWMSRYFDVSQNCVLYGDALLPMEAFLTPESIEMRLVSNVFEFAKNVAELKLTDSQFGLYAAVVLLQSDRPGLKRTHDIQLTCQALARILCSELDMSHPIPIKGDVPLYALLCAKIPQLRELSTLHRDALLRFKQSTPHVDFPELHKEIFFFEPQGASSW